MKILVKTDRFKATAVSRAINEPYYLLLLFNGASSFSVDFTDYACSGKSLLFLSPYQLLRWHHSSAKVVDLLQFHSDFYCIEYHKEEVACNGILFNNIYEKPFIAVPDSVYEEIGRAFEKIKTIEGSDKQFDLSIIRSYIQLILALSSKVKQVDMADDCLNNTPETSVASFKNLLEKHFWQAKSVAHYAGNYGLSANAFSKQIKKQFGKTPSRLIQERLTLEAKRLLHLTYKSIKEIAAELGFEDEFYFSRFFKKEVGVAPKTFRKKTGISIVAE